MAAFYYYTAYAAVGILPWLNWLSWAARIFYADKLLGWPPMLLVRVERESI